jgi:hypothetical protein
MIPLRDYGGPSTSTRGAVFETRVLGCLQPESGA